MFECILDFIERKVDGSDFGGFFGTGEVSGDTGDFFGEVSVFDGHAYGGADEACSDDGNLVELGHFGSVPVCESLLRITGLRVIDEMICGENGEGMKGVLRRKGKVLMVVGEWRGL